MSAHWTQPTLKCTPPNASFSGIWVGLGGFKLSSKSVEQIGTRLDCGVSGRIHSSAWYELAPGPSKPIRMAVSPGDRLRGSVEVTGHQAQLTLSDLTRHETFHKALPVPVPDVSSADWIVEAPTGCAAQGNCTQLPLADFGAVHIRNAQASTRSGQAGSAVSRTWTTTRILMLPDQTPYDPNGTGYAAEPGPLRNGGRVFTVNWLSSGFRYGRRSAGAAADWAGWELQSGGPRQPGPGR